MKHSTAKIVILFYVVLIILGLALLCLPVSRRPGYEFSVMHNLFTAVSSACVIGLSTVDVPQYYTYFGRCVMLLLLQVGALGYMLISMAVVLVIGQIPLKDRRIMQDLFDINSFSDLKKLLHKVIVFVFGIELIGAIILTLSFWRDYSFPLAVFHGVFNSITSFCNAGYSSFSNSMESYANSPVVLYTLAILLVLGGVGFFVLVDIYDKYKNKNIHISLHSKIVLSFTAGLVAFGFLYFFFSKEMGILSGNSLVYSVNNSFFTATSVRTAGFNSVSAYILNDISKTVIMFLMAIGGAPGSTSNGLKVTTLALVLIFVLATLRNREDYVIFKRRIPYDLIKKGLLIFVVYSVTLTLFVITMVLIEESTQRPIDAMFEAISAFSTVGFSLGITEKLSTAGKIVDMLAMIVGRVGILTILLFTVNSVTKKRNIQYPETRILVG